MGKGMRVLLQDKLIILLSQGRIKEANEMLEKYPDFIFELQSKDFCGWNLAGANFKKALVSRTKFYSKGDSTTNLNGACFVGANGVCAIFNEANLSFANLTDSIFNDASFRKTQMRSVNFHKASLINANFDDSYLFAADFSFADLRGASFENVKTLKCAKFRNANLSGTVFRNAKDADCAYFEDTILEKKYSQKK